MEAISTRATSHRWTVLRVQVRDGACQADVKADGGRVRNGSSQLCIITQRMPMAERLETPEGNGVLILIRLRYNSTSRMDEVRSTEVCPRLSEHSEGPEVLR